MFNCSSYVAITNSHNRPDMFTILNYFNMMQTSALHFFTKIKCLHRAKFETFAIIYFCTGANVCVL